MVSCLLTVSTYTVKTIRMAPYLIACSMYLKCQHTLNLAKLAFSTNQFLVGTVSFIFLTIDLIVNLKLICIIILSDLVTSLIFADIDPG